MTAPFMVLRRRQLRRAYPVSGQGKRLPPPQALAGRLQDCRQGLLAPACSQSCSKYMSATAIAGLKRRASLRAPPSCLAQRLRTLTPLLQPQVESDDAAGSRPPYLPLAGSVHGGAQIRRSICRRSGPPWTSRPAAGGEPLRKALRPRTSSAAGRGVGFAAIASTRPPVLHDEVHLIERAPDWSANRESRRQRSRAWPASRRWRRWILPGGRRHS